MGAEGWDLPMGGKQVVALFLFVSLVACSPAVEVNWDVIVNQVGSNYLSVSIDTAQLVGSKFWSTPHSPFNFSRPRLINMAKALSPALLRVGGTTGDEVYYDLSDPPLSDPPGNYSYIMTKAEYDNLNQFVAEIGYELVFGLNLGPGARLTDSISSWNSTNAQDLLKYTAQMQYPVLGFELGNEPNLFMLTFGPRYYLNSEQLAQAFSELDPLMNDINPDWKLIGPDVSFEYPIVGQLVPKFWQDFVKSMNQSGVILDMATYHFYPLLSERCLGPLPDPFEATPEKYLRPETYNKVIRHAEVVKQSVREYQPNAQIWVGETAGSLCGGQPGVANRFIDSLWWMDQLGLLVQSQETIGQVRQTLAGSSYGLINEYTLVPRPDYFASYAFKQLMGNQVLNTSIINTTYVRGYVHCASETFQPGSVTLLLINLNQNETSVQIPPELHHQLDGYFFTPPQPLEITSETVHLNGNLLHVDENGNPPPLASVAVDGGSGYVSLPPNSYSFFVSAPFSNVCGNYQ